MPIARALASTVERAARAFGAVLLTGPRRSGKTTLLRTLRPDAPYYLLEDPDVVARFRSDPRGFLADIRGPVILDEVQHVPEIFNYVRARIDAEPRRRGQWFLTGSQEAPLMQRVTESMAGRAAILHLWPLSTTESQKVSMFRGGYPEVVTRPSSADLWLQSYVQSYLERDVRAVTQVRDLATFRRFVALLASLTGQMLNKTTLAAPLGVSVPTITQWLSVLEVTGQILLVPPYFKNFGKRLVKTPKVYLVDSGLACHLLGIDSAKALERSPFLGAIFEGFVASEIAKQQINRGGRPELYYFRDHQGLEVDFLVPGRSGMFLVEAKASRTPMPAMADSLVRLRGAMEPAEAKALLVHRTTTGTPTSTALRPGVRAVDLSQLLRLLSEG
jgi:predicted AAA+ superfamily ATPase